MATVLLLPVDVALISNTTSSTLGRRKDWATQDQVNNLVYGLEIIYYTLYSVDALLCLIVIPFTYFWYEEYDETEEEEGTQSFASRFWQAAKYTMAFVLLVVIIFLIGFFIPNASELKRHDRKIDYLAGLLKENRGDRALTFALGLLTTIGIVIYSLYTAGGLALLPLSLIKSAPAISAPKLSATTEGNLEQNRERQRQLEARNTGSENGLNNKDRRELDQLHRDERTLVRRQRLAADQSGEGKGVVLKTWRKLSAIFRPITLSTGILLLLVILLLWVSMLITGIDKIKNSLCGIHCGYILGHINIFNPINYVFVQSSKVFPLDYVLFAAIILLFFGGSVIGTATLGIRFLWVQLFEIRKGHTNPQAMLIMTVMLALLVLAINYSIATMLLPAYSTFGPQTYCTRPLKHSGAQPDCTEHLDMVVACSELAASPEAKSVCTPSVGSTFFNRMTLNFPFFGVVDFWAQFAFLAVFMVFFITTLFKTPKLGDEVDEDLEEEEDEGLLASTGRRFGATWEDVRGKVSGRNYGSGNIHGSRPQEDDEE